METSNNHVFFAGRKHPRRGILFNGSVVLWMLLVFVKSGSSGSPCVPCKCERETVMDCSKLGLDKVPPFLNNGSYINITALYLNDNNISRISEGDFEGFPGLTHLYLGNNHMKYIGKRAFHNMDIILLELPMNDLTEQFVDDAAFEGFSAYSLDLSHNKFSEPPKAIAKMEREAKNDLGNLFMHHNPMYKLANTSLLGFPDSLTHVDFSDCHLELIEPRTFVSTNFPYLKSLAFDNNNFTVLDPSFFEGLNRITKLQIQYSNIQEIKKKTFSGVEYVRFLYLNGNRFLKPIRRRAFKDLRVDYLEMKNCSMSWITRGFFHTTVHELLDLSYNNITILHNESFKDLKSIKKLRLSYCNIKEIKGQPFSALNNLESLYLDHNQLSNSSEFLKSDTYNKELHTLDISNNYFQSLPNLTMLTKLTQLYAIGNNIEKIHSDTFLTNPLINLRLAQNHKLNYIAEDALLSQDRLDELDLSWSSLKVLPSLQGLKDLKDLNIVHSDIEKLPSDLCKYSPNLTKITASHNNLATVPDLQNCSKLIVVFLDFNKITHIGQNTFKGLQRLSTLYLQSNQIEEIHPEAFHGLSSLTHLHLSHNKFPGLPHGFFDGLISLESLELQSNKITTLPNNIFKDLAYLHRLYLNDNHIRNVGTTIFPQNMTWLQRLNVSNNEKMTKFPLPRSGFPFLHTLAMMNLPDMLDVPDIFDVPRIQIVHMTYPYHCCIYREYLPPEFLITVKKASVQPTSEDSNTNSSLHFESDETIVTIIRPSSEPLTLPPHIIEGHFFSDYQDPYNPQDHSITQEQIDQLLLEYAHQENLQIRIQPNNEIDFVGVENGTVTSVYGGLNSSTVKKLLAYFPHFNNFSQVSCDPKPDAFMPCENLLDPSPVRVLVWIIWFFAILGNIAVIFVTLASSEQVDVPSFMLCNLAIADFLLGTYLSFLGVVDVRTFGDGSFYKAALYWQKGPGCRTAGFIAVFSSELSVYTLVLLTLERLYTIAYSFNHQNSRMKMWHAVFLVVIGWIFAGTVATLPLFEVNSYTEVAVCLPFRTDYLKDRVYIGSILSLNMIAFLSIMFSYFHIMLIYCRSPANDRLKGRLWTALKMSVLVLTNLVCWLPLTVIGFAAVADVYLINLTVAKYFIVLIFPINACLNPFLYTISKKQFWANCRSICKRTDQKIQEVTSTNRLSLSFRRNSLASGSDTASSHQDIDLDLLSRRQSRRSFSLQLEPSNVLLPQSVSPSPYLGRRYSSPAIFGAENGLLDSGMGAGLKVPSDPTLPQENETSVSVMKRPQVELHRTISKCLSVVDEESIIDEEESQYNFANSQSPLRHSTGLRASADTKIGLQRLGLKDIVSRNHAQVADTLEEVDTGSGCSSEYEDIEERSSPHIGDWTVDSSQHHSTLNTECCGEDEMNRYSSSTTDSYSMTPSKIKPNLITSIINPHISRPVKRAQESTL